MTFEILALICSLGQPPRECVPQTARDHYTLGTEASDLACMRQAQMSAGKVDLSLGPDEYRKFICLRVDK